VALSIVVLLVSGAVRLGQTFGLPDASDAFGARYVAHPVVSVVHIVTGLAFLLLAPLQFSAGVRRRHRAVHRANGRMLVVLAAASGVYALWAAFAFPAFGGLSTQVATVVFGALFLIAIAMAVIRIRARRVAEHREWMIRVFAIALGVATIRAVIGIGQALTGRSMEEVFGAAFWLGFGINCVVAELWIRRTRVGRPSAVAARVV
jgi:uncharacterized membrane protein